MIKLIIGVALIRMHLFKLIVIRNNHHLFQEYYATQQLHYLKSANYNLFNLISVPILIMQDRRDNYLKVLCNTESPDTVH